MIAGLRDLRGVSLEEVNRSAALMRRVDRKYLVPVPLLERMAAELRSEFRVLEISGQRSFAYDTVYFDTPQFRFYRDHVQGRRRRYKVRVRSYLDTGARFLEVKSKGPRGETVKERDEHGDALDWRLSTRDRAFARDRVGPDADRLEAVARTEYTRATLVGDGQRVTCDARLRFSWEERAFDGPEEVIVETKTAGGAGPLDRLLREAGVRPHRVSKYCLAAALLNPELPRNPWLPVLGRFFGEPPRLTVRSAGQHPSGRQAA